MLVKNTLLIFVFAVAALGCNISTFINNGNDGNSNTAKPSPTIDSKPSVANSPKPEPSPTASTFIATLTKSAGKYPDDIKLLDIQDLNERLKKLLGKDFAAMKKNWNVETPMEIEKSIFMASGCEAHNCGANHYLMFVDLKNDNINVFHIEDEAVKHYFESGEIKLPDKFASELPADR
jgi:hypothetical protein